MSLSSCFFPVFGDEAGNGRFPETKGLGGSGSARGKESKPGSSSEEGDQEKVLRAGTGSSRLSWIGKETCSKSEERLAIFQNLTTQACEVAAGDQA